MQDLGELEVVEIVEEKEMGPEVETKGQGGGSTDIRKMAPGLKKKKVSSTITKKN